MTGVRDVTLYNRSVSIHTPTWGVTWLHNNRTGIGMFQSTHLHEVWPGNPYPLPSANPFQSTHLHEVWLRGRCRDDRSPKFQSTHLHEVWLSIYCRQSNTLRCFNPHTYMRCDDYKLGSDQNLRVSIHTPTWGVTAANADKAVEDWFQSTHLHEVWPTGKTLAVDTKQFQSTHLHEVWREDLNVLLSSPVSIHTPTWGVTVL